MNLQFDVIAPSIPYILDGLWMTLQFTLLAALCSIILGTVLAVFKISALKPLKWFGMIYTFYFRGTPLILNIALFYFAIPQFTGYKIDAFEAGVLVLGLNSAAYLSETIRGGIMAVDKGQREAALSLGVPYSRMMRDIILPQAVKNILPAMVNEAILLLKDTAIVSTIGGAELMYRATVVSGEHYLYFEPMIIVAGIYLVVVLLLTLVANGLERRMRRSD